MSVEEICDQVARLIEDQKGIISGLEASISVINESRVKEISCLGEANQKLLERLKKLALERVHPNEEQFDQKLFRGRTKKEKAVFHALIIERADRVSEELEPHFKSLRNALNYQADILKTLRSLSHTIRIERSLNNNIVYKFGCLVYNLLYVSFEISKHPLPEAVLFLYNFIELKKNLGNNDICKDVNSDTFKALRQYQQINQQKVIKSLRKSLAFDKNIIMFFSFITQSLFSDFTFLVRKDIRRSHFETLFTVYDNVLKTGNANLNTREVVHSDVKNFFVSGLKAKTSDILLIIYLLCPTLFLIKEEDHFGKLKKMLGDTVFLNLGKEKISFHDSFVEIINFFPNKKKIRRESKAQQLLSFMEFIKHGSMSNKENKAINSISLDKEDQTLNSIEANSEKSEFAVESFSVKDFLITIDLEELQEALLEAKAGAMLLLREKLSSLQSLYVEIRSAIDLVQTKPEVCAPLAQQLLNLIQITGIVVDSCESLLTDISSLNEYKRSFKVAFSVLKQLHLEVSKTLAKSNDFYGEKIALVKEQISVLRSLLTAEKETIIAYNSAFDTMKVEDRDLINHNVGDHTCKDKIETMQHVYLVSKVQTLVKTL